MNQQELRYYYDAIVTGVYDGDSITVDIDLGLGVWLKGQKLRLIGIDTPEMRGAEKEAGKVARDFVRSRLLGDGVNNVIIKTFKDKAGKFGRWLAVVYYGESLRNLNDELIERGLAEVYPL